MPVHYSHLQKNIYIYIGLISTWLSELRIEFFFFWLIDLWRPRIRKKNPLGVFSHAFEPFWRPKKSPMESSHMLLDLTFGDQEKEKKPYGVLSHVFEPYIVVDAWSPTQLMLWKKKSNIYEQIYKEPPSLLVSHPLSLSLKYFPTAPIERTLTHAFLTSNPSRSFQTNLFHTILHKLSTMLSLNSCTAATTAFAILFLISPITALPTVPHPTSQAPPGKLDPSTIRIHLDEQTIGSSYPPRYDVSGSPASGQLKAFLAGKYGPEYATKLLLTPSGQTKTAATAAPTAAATTTITTAADYRKGRNHLLDRNVDRKESSDNNKNSKDETPLVRIFPNGAFSPFSTEESQEFLILQKSQGQEPPKKVVASPSSPIRGAPPEKKKKISEGGSQKDSKEGSVYNKSRRCEKTGQWCKLPQEGSVLIAGPGIGACTYYKEDGKIISYTPCWKNWTEFLIDWLMGWDGMGW